MKKLAFLTIFGALAASALMSCGNQNSVPNGYGTTAYNPYYPGVSQYGTYGTYGGQQVFIPNMQPPQNWVPGQPYAVQGVPYTPPYYGYMNQPQYWQYNQGIGWNYRMQ